MTQNIHSSNSLETAEIKPKPISLWVTFGFFAFALLLASLGYFFRWLAGDTWAQILPHAAAVLSFFLIGVPVLTCIIAWLMNKYSKTNIHMQNACTLGLLLSCVMILTIMGQYS